MSSLSKKYGNLTAVDNLDLKVPEGELFGLLGPNGAGKSTLIKLLTGQIRPTSGTASVMGIDIKDAVRLREKVGIIPEQENPPSFLTAEEYLEFCGKVRKLDSPRELSRRWLKLMDVDEPRMMCKDLSRGNRQKLMIAQAFLHEPKLAFIDEPLTNLDPVMQRKVKDMLLDYVKKGNTVFFSTHTLEIAHEICTRVCIIDHGKVVFDKKGKDVKNLERLFLKVVGSC